MTRTVFFKAPNRFLEQKKVAATQFEIVLRAGAPTQLPCGLVATETPLPFSCLRRGIRRQTWIPFCRCRQVNRFFTRFFRVTTLRWIQTPTGNLRQ